MMKFTLRVLTALTVVLSVATCATRETPNAVKWPWGVKYEVFVMSFADGDGDGKGDFRGLTSKLDYFSDLGVNGIWLMPIMPSDTYHKYHVVDYRNIDPDYGTLDDFKRFVEEAHKRNISVITDFVINHTGNMHPWFLEAQKGKDNPYRDYYVWGSLDSVRQALAAADSVYDSDQLFRWHPVEGAGDGEHYYGYFNELCPDLNLDNPKVREEIIDIARFWLEEVKVDGFRMDAARHIFQDGRAKDNHEFWVWFREEMEKIKPDVYLVGEVWSSAQVVAPYLRGLPSLFNFDLGYAITDVAAAGKDVNNLVQTYRDIRDYYKSITSDYLDATFVKNHDQTRILTELKGNVDKAKMTAALLLTMPGTPYIYYGEEIGMVGDKQATFEVQLGPDVFVREPFIWDDQGQDAMETSWQEPLYSTAETVVPYSRQKDDPSSLYNFYKDLIQFRNTSSALTYGDISRVDFPASEIVAFVRRHENDEALVVHNVSDVEVTIMLKDPVRQFNVVAYSTAEEVVRSGDEVRVPAYSTLIFHKD